MISWWSASALSSMSTASSAEHMSASASGEDCWESSSSLGGMRSLRTWTSLISSSIKPWKLGVCGFYL